MNWYKKSQEEQPIRTVNDVGTITYRLRGKLHRLDGPAMVSPRGKKWYQNGQLHRTDGPAIEHSNGEKQWWQNGVRHRLDGPAIERVSGNKQYWIDGIQLTEEEFYSVPRVRVKDLDEFERLIQ